jgi:peptidoglycan/LPS O-acetylase OafA/YrhL
VCRNSVEVATPAGSLLRYGVQTTTDRLLARLARRTTTGRYIPEIDGLRFLAITWVFLLHAGGTLSLRGPASWRTGPLYQYVLARGGIGVSLFFVISGFVLALPFAQQHAWHGQRVSLRAYFKRRLTRLEPPYIAAMLLIFALRAATPFAPPAASLGWSLAYLHNLVYGRGSDVNGVAWSLEVEVQFYLIVPVLALVFTLAPTPRRLLLAGLIAVIGVLQSVLHWSDLFVYGQLHLFLAGFLLADWYLDDLLAPQQRGGWGWDLAGVVALVGIVSAYTTFNVLQSVLAFLVIALYVCVFKGVALRRFFTNRWITTIGGMCYSIYLLHSWILSPMRHATRSYIGHAPQGVFYLMLIASAVIVLLICGAFFMLIEQPCMNAEWPAVLAARARLALRNFRARPSLTG